MNIPILTPTWEWVSNLPWYWKVLAIIAFILLVIFFFILIFAIITAIVMALAMVITAIVTLGASTRNQ